MTQFLKVWLAAGLMVLGATAMAHPGHDEESMTLQRANTRAAQVVDRMIEKKQLPASWQKRELGQTRIVESATGNVWVVTFANREEKDAAKKNLYVLFDELGNFIETNHTGKLSASR